jgi:hypothetical protein
MYLPTRNNETKTTGIIYAGRIMSQQLYTDGCTAPNISIIHSHPEAMPSTLVLFLSLFFSVFFGSTGF